MQTCSITRPEPSPVHTHTLFPFWLKTIYCHIREQPFTFCNLKGEGYDFYFWLEFFFFDFFFFCGNEIQNFFLRLCRNQNIFFSGNYLYPEYTLFFHLLHNRMIIFFKKINLNLIQRHIKHVFYVPLLDQNHIFFSWLPWSDYFSSELKTE